MDAAAVLFRIGERNSDRQHRAHAATPPHGKHNCRHDAALLLATRGEQAIECHGSQNRSREGHQREVSSRQTKLADERQTGLQIIQIAILAKSQPAGQQSKHEGETSPICQPQP